MSKRVTPPSAHDVAHLAGVSQAAVSRAFTPGASISPATREKVLMAAKELGYRPNLLARSLITGRSGIVGVVIGNPRNPFFLEAFDTLSAKLSEAGLHLLVFTAKNDAHTDKLVEELLNFRVDALVLMSAMLCSELARQCRSAGIPVIFFNRRALMIKSFASVTGANHKGAYLIAGHLVEQGYRRLAFMAGVENSSTSREREAGFNAYFTEHGLPLPARATGDSDRSRAMEAARQLLSLTPRPDAIFCANDMMAFVAIEVARYDFGLEVGKDIGIAGFDDTEGAAWRTFSLTTYSQPVETMINKVADILLHPDEQAYLPHIVVEGELKIRNSTKRI